MRRRQALLVVFGVALAIRLLHVWQIHDAPFASLRLGDAAAYDAWAREIVAGDWFGHGVFYQAPLYPYFLAVIYSVLGTSATTVRVCQAVVSAGSCALLAAAGARIFSHRAGIAAGLMLALYPPAIFLDTLLQKSVLDVFFVCLVLWCLAGLMQTSRRRTAAALGVALGLLALTRENALVLAFPVLLWIAARRPLAPRARVALAACVIAGTAAVLLPVAVRNDAVGGGFFVTTSQFGTNFYIGNNERADGTYKPLLPFRGKAAFEQADAVRLAARAEGRALSPGEVSAYYTRQALTFIREHPAGWLRLLGRKLVAVWNTTEIADTEDQYTYADWSLPLRLGIVWNLGVLAPLAAIGIWMTAGEWRRLWVLHLMLAVYVASVVAFYVFARYRFPMVPLLMLFAGAALTGFVAFVRARSRTSLAGCAAVAAAVAVFANWPTIPHAQLEAVTHYNFAVGLAAAGRPDAAIPEYRLASALDPRLMIAHNSLGYLLASRGDLAGAERELSEAVRLQPAYAPAHDTLGVVLGRERKYETALKEFEAAATADPSYVDPHRNAAAILIATGRVPEATTELRRAIAAAPDAADLHDDLGVLLAAQGDMDGAVAEFREALRLEPRSDQARRHLARAEDAAAKKKAGAR